MKSGQRSVSNSRQFSECRLLVTEAFDSLSMGERHMLIHTIASMRSGATFFKEGTGCSCRVAREFAISTLYTGVQFCPLRAHKVSAYSHGCAAYSRVSLFLILLMQKLRSVNFLFSSSSASPSRHTPCLDYLATTWPYYTQEQRVLFTPTPQHPLTSAHQRRPPP